MRKKLNVVGIGELLWDVLPGGKKLGGAPCNFVYHAQQQGANGLALSAVGDDAHGKEILETLKAKNISLELIQENEKPTGTVDIKLDENGIPEYTIHENVAWDFIRFNELIKQSVTNADIVCFGSLAQRNKFSHETIMKILICCRPETLVVFDINLRQNFYSKEIIEYSLRSCNVLKMNEEELPVICNLLGVYSSNEDHQVLELLRRYDLKLVAYTKGSEGSLLMTPNEKSYIPTPHVIVKDTIGAGDSFTSAMILGYAKGLSLKVLHQKAVELSANVCTQDGAMPEYYWTKK
jgi:fructokinase